MKRPLKNEKRRKTVIGEKKRIKERCDWESRELWWGGTFTATASNSFNLKTSCLLVTSYYEEAFSNLHDLIVFH